MPLRTTSPISSPTSGASSQMSKVKETGNRVRPLQKIGVQFRAAISRSRRPEARDLDLATSLQQQTKPALLPAQLVQNPVDMESDVSRFVSIVGTPRPKILGHRAAKAGWIPPAGTIERLQSQNGCDLLGRHRLVEDQQRRIGPRAAAKFVIVVVHRPETVGLPQLELPSACASTSYQSRRRDPESGVQPFGRESSA
jgi:hypothetical protein